MDDEYWAIGVVERGRFHRLQALEDAIAYRRARVTAPCSYCALAAPGRKCDDHARDLRGAELIFIPSSVRHGRTAWDLPARYALVYPASGLLADPGAHAAPAALQRLLGPTRAGILRRLDQPASTTHLVALTGLALGTVGTHLRILLDTHLVERRRSGATVLYYRTPLGEQLLGETTT